MIVLLIKRSKHYSFVAFTSSQVSDMQLKIIESTVLDICATLPMFFSRLVPSHLFGVENPHSRFPLTMLNNSAVLCVSGIGFPDAFFHAVKEVIFSSSSFSFSILREYFLYLKFNFWSLPKSNK